MASKGMLSRTKAARRPKFRTSLSMRQRMSSCCTLSTTSLPKGHLHPRFLSVTSLRHAPCTCSGQTRNPLCPTFGMACHLVCFMRHLQRSLRPECCCAALQRDATCRLHDTPESKPCSKQSNALTAEWQAQDDLSIHTSKSHLELFGGPSKLSLAQTRFSMATTIPWSSSKSWLS